MKTVEIDRDFPYLPHPSVTMMYRKGRRYERVPEAAVAAIVKADAGRIVPVEKGDKEPDRGGW